MTETKNILPKIDETMEEARKRAFDQLPPDGDGTEYDAAQAGLLIPETRKYKYRRTLAALGLLALTPLLVKSWEASQHYGYHPQPNHNTPAHIQP